MALEAKSKRKAPAEPAGQKENGLKRARSSADAQAPPAALAAAGPGEGGNAVVQNAKGQWQVRLSPLPKGTSAKSLRTFLGDSNTPINLQLDASGGAASLSFASEVSAKRCLKRWGTLSAALDATASASAPGERVDKRRRELAHRRGIRSEAESRAWKGNSWKEEPWTEEPWTEDSWTESSWNASAASSTGSGREDKDVSKALKPRSVSEQDATPTAGVKGGEKPANADSDKSKSRHRLQELTRQIAGFAAKRRLNDAIWAFDQLLAEGLTASVHAYANLINAYVNSGDMDGAAATFSKMLANGVRSNVVVCTALLKGYCRVGDMAGARSVLDGMVGQDPPVMPDLRLVNTLLRGCVRVGDLKAARSVFADLSTWQLEPDVSTLKFMGSLLSQGLQLKAIGALLRQGEQAVSSSEGAGDASSSGRSLGSSAAADGSTLAPCKFWMKGRCNRGASCQFYHDPAVAQDRSQREESEHFETASALSLDAARAAALLGRAVSCRQHLRQVEAAHKAAEELPATDAHGPSRALQEINRRERQLEMELIRRFLGSGCRKGSSFKISAHLGRSFLLPSSTGADVQSPEQTGNSLIRELTASWGLGTFSKLRLASLKGLAEHFRSCLLEDGRLNWNSVFAGGNPVSKEIPVKLELGAGSGEWVAEQAKSDAGSANWAALELMRDRAHSIFTRAAMEGLENLCVLSGDASYVLPRHISDASIAHIFVNFPEPPFISGSESSESKLHMLSDEAFHEIHRVLRPGGRLTLLSDNGRYCRTLASTVAGLKKGKKQCFQSVSPASLRPTSEGCSTDDHVDFEDVDGVHLYYGWPGPESGHAVKSSSYFDSLWQKGSRNERFFFVLSKR